jgi:hypothetical protein
VGGRCAFSEAGQQRRVSPCGRDRRKHLRPTCIGSHTFVRKMLKRIARNGHVYHQSSTMQDLKRTQGRLQVKLIGVNDASVLPIFCEPHDSGAFSPLEQAPFERSRWRGGRYACDTLDIMGSRSVLNPLSPILLTRLSSTCCRRKSIQFP